MNSIFRRKPEVLIRVGGPAADISGFDSASIQIAADALKANGGGVIELSEGTFDMAGTVRLYSNTHLRGRGKATVLRKANGVSSAFKEDVDYGVYCAKVANPGVFKVGMGILIKDSVNAKDWNTSTSKIIAVDGDTICFDRHTLMNYMVEKNGTVTNACSLLEVIKADNVRISRLAIDGGKTANFPTDSCRGAGIYMHKASLCTVEDVVLYDWNGDGISWQLTEDITVRGTEVCGCTCFGLHPGSGSERPAVENCRIHDNGRDGLYVCWSVKHGIFRDSIFFRNGHSGISIGHKDTDNVFERDYIHHNGKAGVTVRAESEANGAHRNVYRHNTIEDNGNGTDGCGFLFEAAVKENVIEDNIIRDTGDGLQKVGIIVKQGCTLPDLANNKMSGHIDGDIAGL